VSEGSQNFISLEGWKFIQEWVWCGCDGLEVSDVSLPRERLLRMGVWFHSRCCGWLNSVEVVHKIISCGTSRSLKPFGICCGTKEEIIEVSSLSGKWKSREQASATSFLLPGNHWLYRQDSDCKMFEASLHAVAKWADVSIESLKLLFFSQPEADVLSFWLNRQASGSMLL